MIKNGIISLLLILYIGSYSYSQELQHANKIIDVYGQEWYERMQNDAPDLLVLMDKYIAHGFSVRTVSEGKYEQEQVPIEMIPF